MKKTILDDLIENFYDEQLKISKIPYNYELLKTKFPLEDINTEKDYFYLLIDYLSVKGKNFTINKDYILIQDNVDNVDNVDNLSNTKKQNIFKFLLIQSLIIISIISICQLNNNIKENYKEELKAYNQQIKTIYNIKNKQIEINKSLKEKLDNYK